jgi:hypothetical protein
MSGEESVMNVVLCCVLFNAPTSCEVMSMMMLRVLP